MPRAFSKVSFIVTINVDWPKLLVTISLRYPEVALTVALPSEFAVGDDMFHPTGDAETIPSIP